MLSDLVLPCWMTEEFLSTLLTFVVAIHVLSVCFYSEVYVGWDLADSGRHLSSQGQILKVAKGSTVSVPFTCKATNPETTPVTCCL